MAERPYDRERFNRALIANALTDPFNVVLVAIVLIAGLVLGAFAYVLPVAVLVYLGGAARTYFDEDVANRVLERERGRRRERLQAGRRSRAPEEFAPPIRRLLEQARVRERRIRDAIERAELPFDEVAAEIDRFLGAMDGTAVRAELLFEALADTPPESVEARLRDCEDPALREALETQLATLRRMEQQLDRFFSEMERILVELDTVRSQLVSVSASTESAKQAELAGEVRALREQMGATAEGMAAAFDAGSQSSGP